MASHAQVDPVQVVSFAGPPKSAAPLDGSSSIAEADIEHFASIQSMDAALLADVGIPQADIDSMTQNDKVFALRTYVENGGTFS